MDHKAFFLKHWDKEAPATRKVISRIPEDRSDYRADPKARTGARSPGLSFARRRRSSTAWNGARSNGRKCQHLRRSPKS